MAQALGIRFFDHGGTEMLEPLCGGMLSDIARIDATGRLPIIDRLELVVASDVQNPLTGPDGAATIYGPQKGASDEQVASLDAGLAHVAGLIRRDLNIDIEELPGSGAAGGLGGGLVAFAGATVASGIDTVLDAVEFEQRVHGCDLCLCRCRMRPWRRQTRPARHRDHLQRVLLRSSNQPQPSVCT